MILLVENSNSASSVRMWQPNVEANVNAEWPAIRQEHEVFWSREELSKSASRGFRGLSNEVAESLDFAYFDWFRRISWKCFIFKLDSLCGWWAEGIKAKSSGQANNVSDLRSNQVGLGSTNPKIHLAQDEQATSAAKKASVESIRKTVQAHLSR